MRKSVLTRSKPPSLEWASRVSSHHKRVVFSNAAVFFSALFLQRYFFGLGGGDVRTVLAEDPVSQEDEVPHGAAAIK